MGLLRSALSQRWVSSAKCKGMETSLWYPVRDKETYNSVAKISKGVCFGKDGRAPCPVRKECLVWAILGNDGLGEEHGIWGGMSHRERNVVVRKAARQEKSVVDYVEKLW